MGIIGVVAALTLPTLIAMHRKSTVEVAVKKFYTNMNQAIKLSEVEHGETSNWTFPSDTSKAGLEEWFNTYLQKYLVITDYKYEDGIGSDGGVYDSLKLYFPDGSVDVITARGQDHRFYVNASKYDQGLAKDGRDCFFFGFYPILKATDCLKDNYYNKGIEPYINENFPCSGFDNDASLLNWGYYAKVLQRNGWHFPKDYPIKF